MDMTTAVEEMIQSHPRSSQVPVGLAQAITALEECASTCTSCADACLAESAVQDLVRCIRLNLDCADVCATTARVLLRQTEPDWPVIRSQLEACIAICGACGEECDRHADHMEHCRVCAESCRRCADACQEVLNELPAA
jgi:hypothetical protein